MSITANPWGLTGRQVEVLDAVIKSGSNKGAARDLGVAPKTIEGVMHRATLAMACKGSRIKHLILWDRWRQAHPACAASQP